MNEPYQIDDDFELLDDMMNELQHSPNVYHPTNWWKNYEQPFVQELKKLGLHDFKRRRQSVCLGSFRATDLQPKYGVNLFKDKMYILKKLGFDKRIKKLDSALNKWMNITIPYDMTLEEIKKLAYIRTKEYGREHHARSLDRLDSSLYGNPEDVLSIDGRNYTMTLLDFYLRYAYCCRYIEFDKIKVFVELGSGSGQQVEVLRKLYPDMCFFLFDIPPMLYVCEQYLKKVFPDDIVSFNDTKDLTDINYTPGKIFIFGNWKMPIINKIGVDLFWNAASFQEMEPDVVSNYLSFVNHSAFNVFLQEKMDGTMKARGDGMRGVLKLTTFEDYEMGLPDFDCVDVSPSVNPIGFLKYPVSDSFWRKKL